ncbi:hypothetical protein [Streptomyces litchfieldiae]|uniref:Uncharacterized protein n=1 Tax=Streptomyces litchfieldiae TaxID=3075543 RepID=A0ABU2MIV0_9ACTN|nr:hypothetical protein [Streptomyces sp. DSM 44938]MDT0341525.1 hypothetical protein [Streptomyces sp. DSM 44938]
MISTGLLMDRFPDDDDGDGGPALTARLASGLTGLLFVSTSPTTARVVPASHPQLAFVNDAGESVPTARTRCCGPVRLRCRD